jgi:ferric-dicitrate binding protein FerR (iron transport regulator)
VHYVNRSRDSSSMETLWTKNKLVFDAETLQQVALKLERWYGVRVVIQSDRLKNTEYNGVFEDENLSEVLYALQLTGNFNYTIKKQEVIIKP